MPTRRSFIMSAGAAIAAQKISPATSAVPAPHAPALRWAGGNATRLRGLNCLQPFGYGLAKNGSYLAEPYQNGGTDLQVMPDSRLALIKSTGFNFVRMCIDPATLTTAADATALKNLIAQLRTAILRRLAAGLLVIADLHVVGRPPVAGWSNRDIASGVSGTKFQRFIAIAQELSAAIEELNAPQEVAIELFNEPPNDSEIAGDSWPNLQAPYLWRAVRKAAPHSTLLIGGSDYNSINGLATLDPSNFDGNTMYTFHGYTPAQLTLQASPGLFQHIHALTFPPRRSERSAAIRRLIQSVRADASLSTRHKIEMIVKLTRLRKNYGVDTYFDLPQNASYIVRQMKIVTDWADSNGVPHNCIINGESGCNGDYNEDSKNVVGAPLITRTNVIRALSQSADNAGFFGYVIHELQGSGFAISDPHSFSFVPEIIAALGIGPK